MSDGFAFYIEPMMRAAGLGHVTVISNEQAWRDDRPDGLRFVNAHPVCVGCGTCKMQAVLRYRERGPVAFVGEGQTDRYGALYADVTFAKLELVAFCEARRRAVRGLGGLRRCPSRARVGGGPAGTRLADNLSRMDDAVTLPDRFTTRAAHVR